MEALVVGAVLSVVIVRKKRRNCQEFCVRINSNTINSRQLDPINELSNKTWQGRGGNPSSPHTA